MDTSSLEHYWKKYEDNMNLYKYYFDLSIKIIMWYSSVVGAIFAFFILHRTEQYITFILIIPISLSLFLTSLSVASINLLKVIQSELKKISKKLQMDTYPAIEPLILIMELSSIVFTLVAVGLSILFFSNL